VVTSSPVAHAALEAKLNPGLPRREPCSPSFLESFGDGEAKAAKQGLTHCWGSSGLILKDGAANLVTLSGYKP
jgi:hypothetical protein